HCKKYELYKASAHMHPNYEQQYQQFDELVQSSSLYVSDWEKYWLAFLKTDFIDTWNLIVKEKSPMDQTVVFKEEASDIDTVEEKIGALVNDPNFLDDLADVLKSDELDSIFENKEMLDSANQASTSDNISLKVEPEKCGLKSIRGNYFVQTMSILSNLKCYFEDETVIIEKLKNESLQSLERGENPMVALTKDEVSTLKSICAKMVLLSNNAAVKDTHKALLALACKELQHAIDTPFPESNLFLGVNIHTIARATSGCEVSRIISFIENTLLYRGFSQASKSDVMRIFLAVRALQMK
ncbi:hypothetical protein FHG87_000366, partial [Trinorchestia longiramus]